METTSSILNQNNANKKTIGIIGGMGPGATVDLFSKIVSLTPATKDSEHIRILIDDNPMIPSRLEAIFHNGESPIPTLIKMAKSLESMGADFLIMPCNTASYYIEDLRKAVNIPIISIIEETSKYLLKKYPQHQIVGLLGTEMTIRLGLYQKELINYKIKSLCKDHHCEIVEHVENSIKNYKHVMGLSINKDYEVKIKPVNSMKTRFAILSPYLDAMKNLVMKAIYGDAGIKAGKHKEPKKLLIKAIKELEQEGAKIVILGCTELPLVLHEKNIGEVILIDPTKILAESAIEIALGKLAV